MKLYVVVFRDIDNSLFCVELYLADDHDHAEEQCRDANPSNLEIVNVSAVPFYAIERAYYLSKARRSERR